MTNNLSITFVNKLSNKLLFCCCLLFFFTIFSHYPLLWANYLELLDNYLDYLH